MMDASPNCEGPAVVQLHRWDRSQVQLDLSEFREAFISPTRELLLLLSYQCEALLLPLVRGDTHGTGDEGGSCENQQTVSGTSASAESVTNTSESVYHVSSGGDSLQPSTSHSKQYQFLPDVNSLAWGVCEDGSRQQKESLFRELLFVSGNRGVTVHAFCHCDKSDIGSEHSFNVEDGHGIWTEWGPSTASPPHVEARECGDNETGEYPYCSGDETLNNFIETPTSKKWLRSFLTRAETTESDGIIRTWFPVIPKSCHSTKIVSFSLFDADSSFFGFLSWENTVLYGMGRERTGHEPINESCKGVELILPDLGLKADSSVGKRTSYNCSKVFSSYSHNFVGFFINVVDSDFENSIDEDVRSSNKIVLVGRLDIFGIQWLCCVKLEQTTMNTASQWMDFQFSDSLLICLNASGLISFHEVMTGEFVVRLDVSMMYGFNGQLQAKEQKKVFGDGALSSGVDSANEQLDGSQLTMQNCGTVCMGKSCRLIVAPNTSLLGVVDEYGAVYIICGSDHVPKKHFSSEELLPQCKRLGVLAPWDVSYSDISQQKVSSTFLGLESYKSTMRSKRLSLLDDAGSPELHTIQNWSLQEMVNENDLTLSGFSDSFRKHVVEFDQFRGPKLLRNFFLPITKASADDTICFSSLGITRLIERDNTKGKKTFHIAHTNLLMEPADCGNRCLKSPNGIYDFCIEEEIPGGNAVGCIFQGCLYLVTGDGLSVALPRISVSTDFHPVESIGCWSSRISQMTAHPAGIVVASNKQRQLWSPWKVEILDRVLLFETPDEADFLSLENGWGIKFSRLRSLQLALGYLKFDMVEQSLEMLMRINMAEEGVLRLIFAAVYMMFHRTGNENGVSAASRTLSLAARVATKLIREYAMLELSKNEDALQCERGMEVRLLLPMLPYEESAKLESSRRMEEMAHYLEIIRNLQRRLGRKYGRAGQVSGREAQNFMENNLLLEDSQLLTVASEVTSIEEHNRKELALSPMELDYASHEQHALMPSESSGLGEKFDLELKDEVSFLVPEVPRRNNIPVENPKEMITRWEIDNLDLKDVVEDALLSGRLPLAVLQLHLYRLKDLAKDKEPNDTFSEVRDVGRAIAYDLFLKGETRLAMVTLQKLGEDIETSLKQLLLGTLSRPLRNQMAVEMTKYGYIGSHDLAILERLSLIERIYPSCSFWRTYQFCKKESTWENIDLQEPSVFRLLHQYAYRNFVIECGEVDGVVLGSWANMNGSFTSSELNKDNDESSSNAGYWAAAAVWSSAWEQITIDRILLDQPASLGVNLLWESQLYYHICHSDWEEVYKLLDIIPNALLSSGSLQVSLDDMQCSSFIGSTVEFPDYDSYTVSPKELDSVCIDIPQIRILRSAAHFMCSTWLRKLMERQLAKKFIFLTEYFDESAQIIDLLAKSGFIAGEYGMAFQDESIYSASVQDFINISEASDRDTVLAFHRLVIHYCAQYNLPYLLDLYLDHHKLALDNDSLKLYLDAAGDCQWAKWLLFSRVKGREYEASFYNARAIASCGTRSGSDVAGLGTDDILRTVDDIAEGGWLMAALATLMFASFPIQNCLSHGSVNRQCSSSAQCTLENLRPALQQFSTLWRTLLGASLGQDTTSNYRGAKMRNVLGNSTLSMYLNWRDSIFHSSGHDTSLVQLLPRWFPKSVRRLIQLFVLGPLGWQTMADIPDYEAYVQGDVYFLVNDDGYSEISAISWEAALQKQIEQELCASSVKETGFRLDHHLHRGQALAAFNHFLDYRVQKLKDGTYNTEHESTAKRGQVNVQSDVQTLLASLKLDEEQFFSSVIPLAIANYQNPVLVASCAFLLELCGLSASMLRVDISALRRISNFYKSNENIGQNKQLSLKFTPIHDLSEEGDIADSLARALADNYMHQDSRITKQETSPRSKPTLRALTVVLQHLEKASLPVSCDAKTCGSWLSTGNGDGSELRSQQKVASHHWSLVTTFCQMHQIPLSTKYLAWLAGDNDWVGFLYEAQIGGYPVDIVTQVAAKEFGDPRLRTHILTVLRGMQSRSKVPLSSSSDSQDSTRFPEKNACLPVELFGVLAECEKQKQPGNSLLVKAKDLSWSILAMIASCFPDVSPFSCLTVWLEITAARDGSLEKVNDVTSQIANHIAAAVEATNSLPPSDRMITLHYNRRNSKRRRLVDPMPVDSSAFPASDAESTCARTLDGGHDTETVDCNKPSGSDEWSASLPKLVAVLGEKQQFLPLLRAFEMFLPSCSLLPFIRALQAFSQMRLSEASAHLGSFSVRIKEESFLREGQIDASWVITTATKAADAILSSCPSPYEKRSLLQLLAATDFGDNGSTAAYYRQQYWKINLAEPALRKDDDFQLGNEILDDAALLTALETNGHWEQARNWSRQLEATGGSWKLAVHHVTETQAESMVAEWKEFLWDVPEERVALWGHCQTLFIRYSFPALQAGLFFLKHAEDVEKDIPPRELHELLLLSLQWLSGMITQSHPVYPLHLLREIETRVWLLAVESEAEMTRETDFNFSSSIDDRVSGSVSNIIDRTANVVNRMDNHINAVKTRTLEKSDSTYNNLMHLKTSQTWDASIVPATGSTKSKRRAKAYVSARRSVVDAIDKNTDAEDSSSPTLNIRNELQDEDAKIEPSFSRWEETLGPGELERAVLSLLDFGQIAAAKQLQHKLSPGNVPPEFIIVDAALKLAELSTPLQAIPFLFLDEDLRLVIQSYNIPARDLVDPQQVLENLSTIFTEGGGRRLCKRIIAIVKAANILGISFSEAFQKQPTELLQLLSLKAQDSFEEAKLLIQTHSLPAKSTAKILAESFLKGLLAAHRGGYIDSQREEGPAPLLWRFSDFLKWAELCPSEPEIGHALMRLVITGQEIPHACEVELLILSHHFYKSSACLDGVDVLVALAATRVEAYVSEGDFSCLARLITGVGNFHALNFILGILIENGQLDLLLHKYSAAADVNTSAAEAVRGFRMAVLTSLKHFNSNDLDAFAMVYNHFDMKHETAALLESRAEHSSRQWFQRYYKYQNEDLLESMRFYIEAAEVHSSIDAGNKTRAACAQASLVSLQIRMPDIQWLNLSETNGRRALVEQSQFQEALIVAEAYDLNQPSEWALVLWNQMLKPELVEKFVAEFVAVLPLQPSMLLELARFYRSEVAARGDQSQFSVWLTGGGLPAEWAKYLGRSFRCLLKRTRDLRLRFQLASVATGFVDVMDSCNKALDKVPENAGPLVLRKGHGGAYLPLM
ncbi:hypothetical protein Dimus_017727 [Dionaea muscipula]